MAVEDYVKWPETLPQAFLHESYTETPPELTEFNDKVYPPVGRQLRLNGPWSVSGELRMNMVQYARFKDFWRDTIRGGLLKFKATLDGSESIWQIRSYEARPSSGTHWRITLTCFRY